MMEGSEEFDFQAEHPWENAVLPTAPTWRQEEGHRAAQVPLQTTTQLYHGKRLVCPQPAAQASVLLGKTAV